MMELYKFLYIEDRRQRMAKAWVYTDASMFDWHMVTSVDSV